MATATVLTPRTAHRDPRDFVTPELWNRQIHLLTRDWPWDAVMAERVFGQAVSYLITAMETWGQELELCCGRLIDIAVHNFILDTVYYREFCAQHFDGGFLEHIPEITFKYDGSVRRTAQVIAEHGFEVDWKLWERDYARCGPCRPGANCH
ncbi:glycine-rich domain-containing protein [Streptomyces daliensis]|uniref:Uncharacterized protein n=1 Tax=Streptomyces daliensis TaxID=299421 RepID=A0A8T4IRK7_9ACTN|nr:hypothetical protein [Streptomyces daliensis]